MKHVGDISFLNKLDAGLLLLQLLYWSVARTLLEVFQYLHVLSDYVLHVLWQARVHFILDVFVLQVLIWSIAYPCHLVQIDLVLFLGISETTAPSVFSSRCADGQGLQEVLNNVELIYIAFCRRQHSLRLSLALGLHRIFLLLELMEQVFAYLDHLVLLLGFALLLNLLQSIEFEVLSVKMPIQIRIRRFLWWVC